MYFSESRYLLLLTENYGALTILQQQILSKNDATTIFGSSFPADQEYTQVLKIIINLMCDDKFWKANKSTVECNIVL
jgi:hypothetical protein